MFLNDYTPPYLVHKYVALLSGTLRNFRKKSSNLYSFSCPLCGDSTKSKNKARGYIYARGTKFFYRCHNCGEGTTFTNFLRQINPVLFKEYQIEKFKERSTEAPKGNEEREDDVPMFFGLFSSPLDKVCKKISTLSSDHKAYVYLKNRRVPVHLFDDLYFTDNLNDLKNLFPKYKDIKFADEPRIVIPIRDRRKELIGVTARAIYNSKLRYIMLKKDEEVPLIYNLDKVDLNRHIYVTEGAFDSMFLDNAVAVDGSDFFKIDNIVSKTNCTIIMDNQPRNREVVNKVYKVANKGWKVFVWPSYLDSYKDINDLVIEQGMTKEELKKLIDEQSFDGLRLKLKLADWQKCSIKKED